MTTCMRALRARRIVQPLHEWSRKARLVAAALLAEAFAFALLAIGRAPATISRHDKLAHMLASALVTATLMHAVALWPPSASLRRWKQIALVASTAAAAGGLVELVQAFVPHRSADIEDWYYDLIGILGGVLVGVASVRCSQRGTAREASPCDLELVDEGAMHFP